MTLSFDHAVQEIIRAGNRLDRLNLAPATSGNYSMRLGDNEMAITVSGAHKGQLKPDEVIRADFEGQAVATDKRPSAETLLHCSLYKMYPEIKAILHTHSVASTVLTRYMRREDVLVLKGYEMLKAYRGIGTHDTAVRLPIFDNAQDIEALSTQVESRLKEAPETPAYMLRGHGIYGWGHDMAEAMRVIEATEMMLECELNMKQLPAL